MGAPMKCLHCDARWYGMGSTDCVECGSDDIDVDAPPREPDERMLALVALIKSAGGRMDQEDERLDAFCDDRGAGHDTFNLCIDFGLVKAWHNSWTDGGACELSKVEP